MEVVLLEDVKALGKKGILEVNAGVYCFKINELLEILGKLQKSSMGLYYITDVIKMMNTKGLKTGGVLVEDNTEILSLHTKLQLEMLTRILKIRYCICLKRLKQKIIAIYTRQDIV